ncbi:unnamed protein product [Mesocestoides corti]|uniref:Uncharacterized protein n=1 Tax=Mesocestoides corti TaxID=53468 RepID=A0A0R3U6G3_MESCO|nr:unnamed protein product [Mesocestoides corti]
MQTPGKVMVTPLSSSSMAVRMEAPTDATGIGRYEVTVDGVYPTPFCTILRGDQLECHVEGLQSATEHMVTARTCISDTDPAVCSNILTASGWTKPMAPANVTVTTISDSSVDVSVQATPDLARISRYKVSIAEGRATESCTIPPGEKLKCRLKGLQSSSKYEVIVRACVHTTGPDVCSDDVMVTVWTKISLSPGNLALIITWTAISLVAIILLVVFFLKRKLNRRDSKPSKNSIEFSVFHGDKVEFTSSSSSEIVGQGPIDFADFQKVSSWLDDTDAWNQLFRLLRAASEEQEQAFGLTQTTARLHRSLNRYVDMLPYDQSRVILGQKWQIPLMPPDPAAVNGHDAASYINASYVRRPAYTETGAAVTSSQDTQPEYIAAQGPLPHTVADFLTMIYEQRCPHIVMLCNTTEGNKLKCARYWPEVDTEEFASECHSVTVTKLDEEAKPNFVFRKFSILPSNENDPWTVRQIHFTLCNASEVPSADWTYSLILTHLSLLEQISVCDYGPPVVHCSAGVGRTGTFICARYLLERLRKDPSTIDVFGTALAIRRWRKSCVQTAVSGLWDYLLFCFSGSFSGFKSLC